MYPHLHCGHTPPDKGPRPNENPCPCMAWSKQSVFLNSFPYVVRSLPQSCHWSTVAPRLRITQSRLLIIHAQHPIFTCKVTKEENAKYIRSDTIFSKFPIFPQPTYSVSQLELALCVTLWGKIDVVREATTRGNNQCYLRLGTRIRKPGKDTNIRENCITSSILYNFFMHTISYILTINTIFNSNLEVKNSFS